MGKKLCRIEIVRYAMKKGASIGVLVNRLNLAHRYLKGVTKISVIAKQKM